MDKRFLNCLSTILPDHFYSKQVVNTLNHQENCTLITNKKTDYYIHTYHPSILDKNEVFDFRIREHCCNCISISLYYMDTDLRKAVGYFASIRRTVDNVKRNLPDWIVRLYLDPSVYQSLEDKKNEDAIYVNHTLDYLLKADHVKIYVYCCSSQTPMSRKRTFRFLPLFDPEVNIKIIREADGIVTNQDCHNIRIFSKSNYLFYLPCVIEDYDHTAEDELYDHPKYSTRAYSRWLQFYEKHLEPEYFSKYQPLYDLLAGTFGLKLMVKQSYYDNTIFSLQEKINQVLKTPIGKDYYHALNDGFDEILLLHLFRDYISVPIHMEGTSILFTDLKVNNVVLSYTYANHNIEKIDFDIRMSDLTNRNIIMQLEKFIDLLKDLVLKNKDYQINISKFQIILEVIDLYATDYSSFYGSIPSAIVAKLAACNYFIDSLLIEENIIMNSMFNLCVFGSKYDKEKNYLLDYINIPYGAIKSNTLGNIDIKLLPFYDYIYDH